MERTATHDNEYVDIILGYHHVLLFSLVFGALIFGSGYFIGYYRAQSDKAGKAAPTAATATPAESSPSTSLPPVQMPAMLTQPAAAETGDVLEEMEQVSTETLAPAPSGETPPAPAASASPAQRPSRPAAKPAAPAPQPRSASQPASQPAKEPASQVEPAVPQAAAKPSNAAGNVYLQVSSFGEQQQAEQLIDDLAAEGYRALIDGQLVEGKHTVLVGPFSDFKSAVGKVNELKQRNHEAFPIRR